ncbi:MAG: TraB/GumN family protein, partial [Cyclobacteriaceae bacterium]
MKTTSLYLKKTGLMVITIILMLVASGAIAQDGLLYRISGNGLEQPSYIYGTIHLICPDDFRVPEAAQKAFSQTDKLVLELDMDDPGFAAKMQQSAVNPGMKNISSEIGAEDREVINAFFKKHYSADLTQLGVLKPFTLLSMMYLKGLECPQPASSDDE